MRARNAVAVENDPSAHAELRTVRLACKKRKSYSLRDIHFIPPANLVPCAWPTPSGRDSTGWSTGQPSRMRTDIAARSRFPAAELARRSDMQCIVTGPVLRELCNTLFTDPRMLEAFATWGTRKE